jgi:hypothetical protein
MTHAEQRVLLFIGAWAACRVGRQDWVAAPEAALR